MSKFSPEVRAIFDRVMADGERDLLERAGATPSRDLAEEKWRLERHLDSYVDLQDNAVVREALARINRRLDGWMGSGHYTARRTKYHHAIDRTASVPTILVDPIEFFIFRMLAQTTPARQYGVSKEGAVFSASTNGYSRDDQRIWISGLSRAAEDVGHFYYAWRARHDGKQGGRFFERDGIVFDASRRSALVRLESQA